MTRILAGSSLPAIAPREGTMQRVFMTIYQRLRRTYGPMNWWPGETAFEVMVGAILTQNTSWKNVEKAIQRLKEERVLTPEGIQRLRKRELSALIRSSGFYRIKTDRLKAFTSFLFREYQGKIENMKREPLHQLRRQLLKVKGIGPETADSILLYGLQKPTFVVDAYTRRIFSRHGFIPERASYEEIQSLFMAHLPADQTLFNEYHALLVQLGKRVCKKNPECNMCPLRGVWRKV